MNDEPSWSSANGEWTAGAAVHRVMDSAWKPAGYTSPNPEIYPWMWLWDSCFHVIIWHALGDERAAVELESIFSIQDPGGFMPHMGYQEDPEAAMALWGRSGSSVITQPPMYGHALRVLHDAGIGLPGHIVDAAARAFRHLLDHRLRGDLAVIVHPWESGCAESCSR